MSANAICSLHAGVSATGVCPRCGAFVCAQCELDSAKNCPACVKLVGAASLVVLPWERRHELGVARALYEQVKLAVFKPGTYVAAIDPNRPWREAFFFGWAISAFAGIASAPYNVFSFWSQSAQMRQSLAPLGRSASVQTILDFYAWVGAHPQLAALALVVYAIAIYPPMFFLNAGAQQLGLAVMGVTNRRPLNATLRATAYASAVNALLAIPVVGGFAGLYSVVLQVWALREVHRTSTLRALVAVLWLGLALGCCGLFAGIAYAASMVNKL